MVEFQSQVVALPVETVLKFSVPPIFALIGWLMKQLWDAVLNLRADLASLGKEFSQMEKELPLTYVQKDDYKEDISRVHELLDKIYDKLETKVSK
jgi:hypothetical protein